MKEISFFYRKNIFLLTTLLVLIISSLIAGLVIAFALLQKYVENEFYSKKIEVLDSSIISFNDFFHDKIPEISFYQGFLDSASAAKYVQTVLEKYPFVEKIVFYDTEVSNSRMRYGITTNNLSIVPVSIYQYGLNLAPDSSVVYKNNLGGSIPLEISSEFHKAAIKFSGYIEVLDTTSAISNEISNVFYNISPNRITYMNVPRPVEMKIFKELMFEDLPPSPKYGQDIMTFHLSPSKLEVVNSHEELYQEITIKPLVFESLDTNPDLITTSIPLYGPFGDYKLYFTSSKQFLRKEVIRRFFPIAISILAIYGLISFIAYLIYRNLNINRKMFKLQYDLINNLTHEFKTPVSVIKIAGNNIKSAKTLSDKERFHYGKILDEEADKLNNLLNTLLSFTQIENRSIQLKEEVINLKIFVQNVIDKYQLKAPNFNIDCRIKNVELFKTDPILLTSLFQNLIDNAYKYSDKEKDLLISVYREKKNIVFRFKDKGIGIPDNELENIFKKFYRIQSQFNQQGSVGLGLAFCKQLVNFMNGEITVKSKVGKGSEFIVTLPYLI